MIEEIKKNKRKKQTTTEIIAISLLKLEQCVFKDFFPPIHIKLKWNIITPHTVVPAFLEDG